MARARSRRYARRSAAQWARLVAEQETGALSQRAFCAERGLAYGSFCGWKRRLREAPARAATRDAPAFVELAAAPVAQSSDWDVELALGEGVVLRLRRVR